MLVLSIHHKQVLAKELHSFDSFSWPGHLACVRAVLNTHGFRTWCNVLCAEHFFKKKTEQLDSVTGQLDAAVESGEIE